MIYGLVSCHAMLLTGFVSMTRHNRCTYNIYWLHRSNDDYSISRQIYLLLPLLHIHTRREYRFCPSYTIEQKGRMNREKKRGQKQQQRPSPPKTKNITQRLITPITAITQEYRAPRNGNIPYNSRNKKREEKNEKSRVWLWYS